jgi:hypothetical protein
MLYILCSRMFRMFGPARPEIYLIHVHFALQILNFERSSACPRCSKVVLYRHAKFLLEALITYYVGFRTKLNQFKHIDHAYLPYHYIHTEKAYNCLMHRPRRRYYIWRRPCYPWNPPNRSEVHSHLVLWAYW